MSPEAQRIAIGKSVGKLLHDGDHAPSNYVFATDLPDYLNDLNAMYEAVKSLPQNLKPRYFACLCAVVSGAISLNGYSEATEATAAQRSEAYLRAIGKWEGGSDE
jgi:hypothetical protein